MMALLRWELRKIWRPGILAAILLLGAVYYWMFPQFYIEYFCNGPSGEAQFDLASDWVARYGPTLEPEERAQLDGQLAEETEPAIADFLAAYGDVIYDMLYGEQYIAGRVNLTDG